MIDYVPLGSVVLLQGGVKKVLVISRGLNVRGNNKVYFFDYAGVPYPEGLVSDEVAYFNHDIIAKVVFRGYQDVDDEVAVENINRYLDTHPDVIKGTVEVFNS